MNAQERGPSQELERLIGELMPEPFHAQLQINLAEGCEGLATETKFQFVLQELVNNCAEKDAQDIQVQVTIGLDDTKKHYIMRVEDNVQYTDEYAETVLRNLNNRKPKQMGKKSRIGAQENDVSGLQICKKYFSAHHGKLIFSLSRDNRVIAEAFWEQ